MTSITPRIFPDNSTIPTLEANDTIESGELPTLPNEIGAIIISYLPDWDVVMRMRLVCRAYLWYVECPANILTHAERFGFPRARLTGERLIGNPELPIHIRVNDALRRLSILYHTRRPEAPLAAIGSFAGKIQALRDAVVTQDEFRRAIPNIDDMAALSLANVPLFLDDSNRSENVVRLMCNSYVADSPLHMNTAHAILETLVPTKQEVRDAFLDVIIAPPALNSKYWLTLSIYAQSLDYVNLLLEKGFKPDPLLLGTALYDLPEAIPILMQHVPLPEADEVLIAIACIMCSIQDLLSQQIHRNQPALVIARAVPYIPAGTHFYPLPSSREADEIITEHLLPFIPRNNLYCYIAQLLNGPYPEVVAGAVPYFQTNHIQIPLEQIYNVISTEAAQQAILDHLLPAITITNYAGNFLFIQSLLNSNPAAIAQIVPCIQAGTQFPLLILPNPPTSEAYQAIMSHLLPFMHSLSQTDLILFAPLHEPSLAGIEPPVPMSQGPLPVNLIQDALQEPNPAAAVANIVATLPPNTQLNAEPASLAGIEPLAPVSQGPLPVNLILDALQGPNPAEAVANIVAALPPDTRLSLHSLCQSIEHKEEAALAILEHLLPMADITVTEFEIDWLFDIALDKRPNTLRYFLDAGFSPGPIQLLIALTRAPNQFFDLFTASWKNSENPVAFFFTCLIFLAGLPFALIGEGVKRVLKFISEDE